MKVLASNVPEFMAPNGSLYTKIWGELRSNRDGIIHVGNIAFKIGDNTVVAECPEYPDVWRKNGISQRVYEST